MVHIYLYKTTPEALTMVTMMMIMNTLTPITIDKDCSLLTTSILIVVFVIRVSFINLVFALGFSLIMVSSWLFAMSTTTVVFSFSSILVIEIISVASVVELCVVLVFFVVEVFHLLRIDSVLAVDLDVVDLLVVVVDVVCFVVGLFTLTII